MFRFFKKTRELILSEQKSILSSALIISFMYAISRILGFIRYRIFAYYFTKEQLDVFFASFRLPDTIFEILVLGALSYSFVPIFIKWKAGLKRFSETLSSLINFIFLTLLIISLFLIAIADKLVPILTPGFSSETQKQIVFFTKLLLLFQVPFLTLGNILQFIAQAERYFLIIPFAPLLYNLAIIIFTLIFGPHYSIFAPILGALVGSFLFFLSQTLILLKSSFKYSFRLKFSSKFKEFFSLSFSRMLTLITKQIEAVVELALASLLGVGAYTSLYLAQRLQFLPVSLIGQSIAQASYPYITELSENKKNDVLSSLFKNNLQMILFLTIPISAFFIFARTPLVRLFFGGPKFDWEATVTTAYTLSFFALAVPFHSIFYLLTRTFFSLFDAKKPLIINSLSTLINLLLNLYFVFVVKTPVWYMALAFSLSITLNSLLLLYFLNLKIKIINKDLIINFLKIIFATFLSSFLSYYFMRLLDGLFIETTTTLSLILLLSSTSFVFISLYLIFSWLFEIKEFYAIPKLIFKIEEYRKKIIHFYTEVE